MSWQAAARRVAQRAGLDPRYVRRLRWLAKAGSVRRAGAKLRSNLGFILTDPEPDNFTYALANEPELAEWVRSVSGRERVAIDRVLDEVHHDRELGERLRRATARRWSWSKPAPPFGKRVAWYALARLCRPELIVETGVHDGLGSLLLLRALERNRDEGAPGELLSFDVNPAAGWIVGEHPLWQLRIEPTQTGLGRALDQAPPLGLFIHDSLHTYENERFELRTAAAQLAPAGVLITDNAHVTSALRDTCEEFGLRYFEFRERPLHHFYPGGKMGAGRRQSERAPASQRPSASR
ncbi:MAG: class I SAM-dependent methyltransferase [Solirubrobacterales bacterium]|nr:class I SAM-dependent methyltransferase [Solirubrobacterales bacterium]